MHTAFRMWGAGLPMQALKGVGEPGWVRKLGPRYLCVRNLTPSHPIPNPRMAPTTGEPDTSFLPGTVLVIVNVTVDTPAGSGAGAAALDDDDDEHAAAAATNETAAAPRRR